MKRVGLLSAAKAYSALLILTGSLSVSLMVGCLQKVSISISGHAIAEAQPVNGAVFPYPQANYAGPSRERSEGPYLMVFLSTPSNLRELAKRKGVHHLYYTLFPCSRESDTSDLCSGNVFEVGADETFERIAAALQDETLYKVYVPLEIDEIAACTASIQGGDAELVLREAREHGLCLVLGAGNMWGEGVYSNQVRLPVSIIGDALEVARGSIVSPP